MKKCSKKNEFFFFRKIILDLSKHLNPGSFIPHLYQDLPPIGSKIGGKPGDDSNDINTGHGGLDNLNISTIPSFGSKLGLLLPNPAPDVSPHPDQIMSTTAATTATTGPFSKYHSEKNTHTMSNMLTSTIT